jgi:L-iditol 2-dehydrogenase
MKAAVFNGISLQVKNVKDPELKDHQVLIQVKAAGICGTDLAIIKGELSTPLPVIPGHEFTGRIVKVGKVVSRDLIGMLVTCEINANIDFDCYYCKKREFTQCISRKAIGIDINGAFAEFIAVDDYLIHEVPPSISYKEATFIEPLAAAYQTFEMMPLDKSDAFIAIFGLGKLGLLITQVAKLNGLTVIGIDGSTKKLELAKKFGAKHLINRLKMQDVAGEIRRLTGELGADIVLDATGNPEAFSEITRSCRSRGKIHVKSTYGLATPINLTELVVREISIYTSRCGPFKKALDGVKSGQIKVSELISAEFTLDSINDAIKAYVSRDHIKSLILL